jgi:hypothetical protein
LQKESVQEVLDFSECSISIELHKRLSECAELYNITGLEKILTETESDNNFSKKLLEHLRKLTNTYDMEAIHRVMETVTKV